MRMLCVDCEGPITLNDNAFEICEHFLPRGAHFFKLISSFDDYLVGVVKKKNYSAGSTLKLIIPFLKAYEVSNEKIKNHTYASLRLIPGAKTMLQELMSMMEVSIISTSYTPYIQALCDTIKFPLQNTFSTALDLNSLHLATYEKKKLLQLYEKINTLSLSSPSGKTDVSDAEMATIQKLDTIFFGEIATMSCGKVCSKVRPVGGIEKERAVQKAIKIARIKPEDLAYAGDSITDAQALKFTRKQGGLSIAFNGNRYALNEAEFACIANHSYPLFVVVKKFNETGKKAAIKIASNWPNNLSTSEQKELALLAVGSTFARLEKDNFSHILKLSTQKRNELRGEQIGSLG